MVNLDLLLHIELQQGMSIIRAYIYYECSFLLVCYVICVSYLKSLRMLPLIPGAESPWRRSRSHQRGHGGALRLWVAPPLSAVFCTAGIPTRHRHTAGLGEDRPPRTAAELPEGEGWGKQIPVMFGRPNYIFNNPLEYNESYLTVQRNTLCPKLHHTAYCHL